MRTVALLGILAAATAARLHALDLQLWVDEIETLLHCRASSAWALATSYPSQNHHVLYSLTAKLSLALFGESATALRLPAVLFGIGGVAAVHALGREVASPREGLLAAALLAVSYHHVWFSQNARGYTALACFALLQVLFLRRALAAHGRRDWVAYGVLSALAVYTHVTMALVVVGQALVALWVLWLRPASRAPRDRSAAGERALLHAALGFGTAALLAVALYAPMLGDLVAVNAVQGRTEPTVAWTRPSWALGEMGAGLGTAFGGAAPGAAVLALGLFGLARLWRRDAVAGELIALPPLVAAVALAASGHHLWPRFFFFGIGFAALAAVEGTSALGEALASLRSDGGRRAAALGTAGALLLVALAAAGLPVAYAPKQRFREALELIERERAPGDVVAVFDQAALAVRDLYGADARLAESAWDLVPPADGRLWVVYAFPVAFEERHPDVKRALDGRFEQRARFEGTVGGGDVVVWRSALPGESSDGKTIDR